MMGLARGAIGVIVGFVTWVLVTYLGLVVVMLGFHGIPLGAPAWKPTVVEYALMIGAGAIGAAIGGRVALACGNRRDAGPMYVLPLLMMTAVLWSFAKPSSTWPDWWAPTLALLSAVSCWSAVAQSGVRDRSLCRSRQQGHDAPTKAS